MSKRCKINMCLFLCLMVGLLGVVLVMASQPSIVRAQIDNRISDVHKELESEGIEIPLRSNKPSPIDMTNAQMSDFTDVKYIANKNYFSANPKHFDGSQSTNIAGACTTIAMQMLIGYHNYYTDRRLIPQTGENGRQFLNADYGNINEHPDVLPGPTSGQGRPSTGTEDGFYQELYDINKFAGAPGMGQAADMVTLGANNYVDKYAQPIKNSVSITQGGGFYEPAAHADIDFGLPFIVGI